MRWNQSRDDTTVAVTMSASRGDINYIITSAGRLIIKIRCAPQYCDEYLAYMYTTTI